MRTPVLLSLVIALAACHQAPQEQPHQQRALQPAAPAPPPALTAEIARINQAPPPVAAGTTAPADAVPDPFILRAEALLARAHISPGVADGRLGSNLAHAVAAYQGGHDLPASGTIDAATWQALLADPQAQAPVARIYAITPADVAGPFALDVGEDFQKLAALPQGPLFVTPIEALAERFHMSQALLQALNPGANFAVAGTQIAVIDDAAPGFAKGDVDHIEVSKSDAAVRAYDADGRLIAFYPATVGSTERPSPSGTHKVKGVAWNPPYTYDPAKLRWGPRAAGKLVIKPGPNGPVGTVWIDLDAPSYGLHGTPDPDQIGKTASHGCVRMTNWDAQALATGVKPGVTVRFLGQRGDHAG